VSDGTSVEIDIADVTKLSIDQVEEMKKLTDEQYSEVCRQVSEMKEHWWFFPDYVWFVGIIAALFCILYFTNWIILTTGLVVMIYCVSQLGYRAGVSYGYLRGYQEGHEEGIHKAIDNILGDNAGDVFSRAFDDKFRSKFDS